MKHSLISLLGSFWLCLFRFRDAQNKTVVAHLGMEVAANNDV
jgi:hypothetical protein